MSLRSLLKEPLLHFLAVGGIVFAAYSWLNPAAEGDEDRQIVLDDAQLGHLTRLWKAQWKHDPAPEDLAAIIQRHLQQEVFYREALKLGLDHNDEIVRKRLAQKMEAVASDLSTLMQPPTDEALRSFFTSREDLFKLPQAYAFQQVLFLPNEPQGEAQMQTVLASLQQGGAVPIDRQNKLALAGDWPLTSIQDLDNAFGPGFTAALKDLPQGQWSGPVRSGYGWHLVRIEADQPPAMPEFDLVRDFVARQYEYYAVLDAQAQIYNQLLRNYDLVITADIPAEIRAGLTAK